MQTVAVRHAARGKILSTACYVYRVESRRHVSTYNPFSWMSRKIKDAKIGERLQDRASKNLAESTKLAAENPGAVAVRNDGEKTSTTVARPKAKPRKKKSNKVWQSHGESSPILSTSARKLKLLSSQISGKPIDHAILQMQFSEKRVSLTIQKLLQNARHHAINQKNLDPSRLIVAESWVNKGKKASKKLEPRGRGHFGIRIKERSRMKIVLKEGQTLEEKKAAEHKYKLNRVVSANSVREDKPIRKPGAMWTW